MSPKMTVEELRMFLKVEFPQVGDEFVVEHLETNAATIRLQVTEANLRPGGTVSGLSMFALADVAFYLAVIGMIGPKAMAVTTSCAIDFMRKPAAGCDLIGQARILKLGRVLAVGDVVICSEGDDAPVARASLTYSLPPKRV